MSQENVEIVKAVLEAWNAGYMEAVRELYDPNVIVRMPDDWPEPGPFMGRDAVMRQVKQLRDTWNADTLELISDFIDVGDRVAVRYVWRAAPWPGVEHSVHARPYRAQGQDRRRGGHLGSRRGPRNPGAVGIGDVAGERGVDLPSL